MTRQSESAHDLQVSDKSGRDGGRYNLKDESLKCSTGEGNKQGKPHPFFSHDRSNHDRTRETERLTNQKCTDSRMGHMEQSD